jgi:F0F1-type ATP synthase membrane subunit c/vacuolar-type H+-ATPase subunit K
MAGERQPWVRKCDICTLAGPDDGSTRCEKCAAAFQAGVTAALAAVRTSMMVGPVVAQAVAGEAERALAAKETKR